ncbi:MAG: HD-GYP domain-containing protein [Solirubrobacteraceae bacterium]
MFSSFELFSTNRRGAAFARRRVPTETTASYGEPAPTRLLRYLPLVMLTTASVVVLPAVLVVALMPRGSWLLTVASTVLTVVISVAVASVESAIWTRRPGSRDLVFAELLLWGWLRRYWTERRLDRARALYDSITKAGLTVSIELLEGLSERLQARDVYTHGHSQRVARHVESIARAMHLPPTEVAKIRTAAAVHDVGKIYTPREILTNPGSLNDREYAIVKLHAGDGAEMLEAAGDPEITAIVRHHHERVDGQGYPDGLRGSSIPLGARIIAVADTFDAITSNRPYRPGASHKRGLEILSKQAGSQLDSAAVAAFLSSYSSRRSVAWFALAAALPQRIFAALQTASPSIGANGGTAISMLPALGAASLLTLSPGLRHDTATGRHGHRQPIVARSHQSVASVTRSATTRPSGGPATGTQPARPDHRRAPRTVRVPATLVPIRAPVSRQPATTTPAPTASSAGTREPVAVTPAPATPAPPPAASSPASVPTTPSPAPTPVEEAPRAPEQPSSPPVKLPGISLPSVPLPSVPLPGVPPLSTPGISVPSISIPTTEVLGVKIP